MATSGGHPTEPTYSSDLKEWINEIIKTDGLPFSEARVEIAKERKRSDIILFDAKRKCSLIIEVKRPEESPTDPGVVKQAADYAKQYEKDGLRYYATHNVNTLVLWDAVTGTRVDQFAVTFVRKLDDYDRKRNEIIEASRRFLHWYSRFLAGEPPKSIDEGIISILHNHIGGILSSTGIVPAQIHAYSRDKEYRRKFDEWLADKGWSDPAGDSGKLEDYCSVISKQFLYIFVNKVLFYYVLRVRYPKEIPNLALPASSEGGSFHSILETYFTLATQASHDYETVFLTNFIDRLPLPNDAVEELVRLANYLSTLDYSTIGYDITGKVFEKLIPAEERHTLGQYFTPSDLVDVILSFCLKNSSSVVLDPACGSGTFLVRSYYRMRYLDGALSHPELLSRLWGVDIDKFPAHLATINLAIRDLSETKNYPNVIYKDFFEIPGPRTSVTIGVRPTLASWGGEESRPSASIKGLDAGTLSREIPEVGAIVGNPPYTRQEELQEDPFGLQYKKRLQAVVAADFPGLDLGKRSGIYSYFFPHGARFLGKGGRLGFICLRSWLDTGYGIALKQFIVGHFKIVAIIESGAERWFEDAQMLPVMVILEVSNSRKTRDQHQAKFIRLKVPLREIVPPIISDRDMLQEIHRWKTIDSFTSGIESSLADETNAVSGAPSSGVRVTEDGSMRIIAVRQDRLSQETKWGKYLGAPSVLFRVFEAGVGKLVPLQQVAVIKRGITTGANEFFCMPGTKFRVDESNDEIIVSRKPADSAPFKINKTYLRPVVVKIKSHKEIPISKADGYILALKLGRRELEGIGGGILDYVRYGETTDLRPSRGKSKGRALTGYQNLPTVAARDPWYELPIGEPPSIIFPSIFLGRHVVFLNRIGAQITNAHFGVTPLRKEDTKVLCAYLNSSLAALLTEYSGRYIENRDRTISNQVMVFELKDLPVIDPASVSPGDRKNLEEAFDELCQFAIGPRAMFDEEEMARKETLDEIICCDILGLSRRELTVLRTSLAETVKTRSDRASQATEPDFDVPEELENE